MEVMNQWEEMRKATGTYTMKLFGKQYLGFKTITDVWYGLTVCNLVMGNGLIIHQHNGRNGVLIQRIGQCLFVATFMTVHGHHFEILRSIQTAISIKDELDDMLLYLDGSSVPVISVQ